MTKRGFEGLVRSDPRLHEVYENIRRRLPLDGTAFERIEGNPDAEKHRLLLQSSYYAGTFMAAVVYLYGMRPASWWFNQFLAAGGLTAVGEGGVPMQEAAQGAAHEWPWECVRLSANMNLKTVNYSTGMGAVNLVPLLTVYFSKDSNNYTSILLKMSKATWKAIKMQLEASCQNNEQRAQCAAMCTDVKLYIPLSHVMLHSFFGPKPNFVHIPRPKVIACHFFCFHQQGGTGRAYSDCINPFHITFGFKRSNALERVAHLWAEGVVPPRVYLTDAQSKPSANPGPNVNLHPSKRQD